MLPCTLAFAAVLGDGLGDAVTVVFAFVLLFEFSAVLHAAPKTANIKIVSRHTVRRISIPPVQRSTMPGATLPRVNACS
jgi:hypothetical protein